MHHFPGYADRHIRYLQQIDHADWRIKTYGIAQQAEASFDAQIEAARQTVLPSLPQPALNEHRYGVGFLIIHQGSMANWLLLDWWEHVDILRNLVFSAPHEDPANVQPVTDKGIMSCVYELEVQQFERQAWIDTVLKPGGKPDFGRYLNTRL